MNTLVNFESALPSINGQFSVGVNSSTTLATELPVILKVGEVVGGLNIPKEIVSFNAEGRLVVVLVKNPDYGANVDGVIGINGDGEVTGTAVELTQ